jgi:hypothetical protein
MKRFHIAIAFIGILGILSQIPEGGAQSLQPEKNNLEDRQLGIAEVFARSRELNGKKICVSGFIGGDGGSGMLLALIPDHLSIVTARHECIVVTGDKTKPYWGSVAGKKLYGQYVYVSGLLHARTEGNVLTALALTDADITFQELIDNYDLIPTK